MLENFGTIFRKFTFITKQQAWPKLFQRKIIEKTETLVADA